MRILSTFTIVALHTLGDTGNSDLLPFFKLSNPSSCSDDFTTEFVSDNSSWFNFGHPAVPDVLISSTNGRGSNFDYCVCRFEDFRVRYLLKAHVLGTVIHKCFHLS